MQGAERVRVTKLQEERNLSAACLISWPSTPQRLIAKAVILGKAAPVTVSHTAYPGKSIIYHRSTKIGLDTILDDNKHKVESNPRTLTAASGSAGAPARVTTKPTQRAESEPQQRVLRHMFDRPPSTVSSEPRLSPISPP